MEFCKNKNNFWLPFYFFEEQILTIPIKQSYVVTALMIRLSRLGKTDVLTNQINGLMVPEQ